jgi:hypothetical protein
MQQKHYCVLMGDIFAWYGYGLLQVWEEEENDCNRKHCESNPCTYAAHPSAKCGANNKEAPLGMPKPSTPSSHSSYSSNQPTNLTVVFRIKTSSKLVDVQLWREWTKTTKFLQDFYVVHSNIEGVISLKSNTKMSITRIQLLLTLLNQWSVVMVNLIGAWFACEVEWSRSFNCQYMSNISIWWFELNSKVEIV